MAKSPFAKRDEQRELSRRALIKWTLATGAALGVSRGKLANILDRTAGRETAEAATELAACRSIHIMAGNGGFAWFNLLWPHNAIAAANNANFSWHRPGQSQVVAGTDKPLTIGPDTPWAALPANRQVTAFMCGNNATHNRNTNGGATLNGATIYAIATALQAQNASIIRAVAFGDTGQEFGNAAGSAVPAGVNAAAGFVNLFNSAASRAGGLLSKTTDADLYKAHYDAMTATYAAAKRPTTKAAYNTGKGAAQFLGKNLASQLEVTQADLTRYGIDGNMRGNVADLGRSFIVAVKAFKMGLTNCIALPAFNDDPHGAFNGDINTIPGQIKKIFDGLMTDLRNTVDDTTGRALDLDTVITMHGDTPKEPLQNSGWPDGTSRNSNWTYVYSAGHLKSGWFGGYSNAGAEGFNAQGANTAGAYDPNATARFANASIAYALAKRDERAIQAFANGITVSGVFGRPKEL